MEKFLLQDQKWMEFKNGVRSLWADITPEEIDETQGNLEALAVRIQNHTGDTWEHIQEQIQSLLRSFDNETDKYNYYISSYQRSPLGPDEGATSDKWRLSQSSTFH